MKLICPFPPVLIMAMINVLLLSGLVSPVNGQNQRYVLLDNLDISKITQGTDRPRSTGEHANLKINKQRFSKGIHTRTESQLYLELDGKTDEFSALVGVDDRGKQSGKQAKPKESSFAEFFIIGDGNVLWKSDLMKFGDTPKPVKIKLTGIKQLLLKVTGGPGRMHVDWVDAGFSYSGLCPKTRWSPGELSVSRINLQLPEPRINGAMITGIRPNTPFLYPIAATGERPMAFRAHGLPSGLMLNRGTGIISGTPEKAGEYKVKLSVSNCRGRASRTLKIVVGDNLALTPPMGFLSWNVIEGSISSTVMCEMADAFVTLGLRDVGYQYIVMDDCWEGTRDGNGRISADRIKFPDGLKSVGDYLHERGLKFGLYSSPGATTCAGYPGTLGYEKLDVNSWASWGFDYLKYDYCSVPKERARELYILMGGLLEKSGRSVIYGVGAGDISPVWGKDSGAHLWRTAGDIRDQWYLGQENGLIECFDRQQPKFTEFQRPGAWNDPDMLLTGIYGRGASANDLNAKGCTDTEYRTQMSLWALLSAPLFISADVRNISPAALEILTNPEVIDVNQDPAGNLPKLMGGSGKQEVWVKEMEDGSKTIALLNRASEQSAITVRWEELGLKGKIRMRDLWLRKEMGVIRDSCTTVPVLPHGVVLIRISKKD